MNKFKSTIKLLAVVVASSLMLAACGGEPNPGPISQPSPDEITLEYWRLYDESEIMDPHITAYQREHPNVEISVIKKEIGPNGYENIFEYRNDVIKQIADGGGPDIFEMRNNWLPYQKNHIIPMPTEKMSAERYQDLYPPVVSRDFLRDGKIYAVPLYIDNLMLYYNPNLFLRADIDEPPETWQDVVDLVPKLTRIENGELVQSAITLGVTDPNIQRFTDILAALMLQNGAQMSEPSSDEILFHLPHPEDPELYPASQALEFYTSFADPNTENFTYTDQRGEGGTDFVFPRATQAFMEGKAAMFVGYQYHSKRFNQVAPDLPYRTAPLPQVNPENPVTIANYWGEAVAHTSDHPEVAWDFLKFLTTSSQQSRYTSNAGRVSPRDDFGLRYRAVPVMETVYSQLGYSQSWYVENIRGMEDIFAEMVNNVLKHDVEPRTAVESAVQKLRAL